MDGWSLPAYCKVHSKSASNVETPHESEQNMESKRGFWLHPLREHVQSFVTFEVPSLSVTLSGFMSVF